MDDPDLVVVKTFTSRVEAELAKGALESAGIDSMVRADDAGGEQPGLWMSGVALLVRAEDQEAAEAILGGA